MGRDGKAGPTAASHLTVVIPLYNEAARLEAPLRTVGAFLAAYPGATDIVLVDDGSIDDTAARAKAVAREVPVPVRLLRYGRNRGKGYALKVGFAHATGDRILFTDVDLSTPIEQAPNLLAALDAGHDVVIGSRKMAGAEVTVRQPWYRERMGKAFTWLTRRLLADVSDVTCGFKAFRGDAGRELFVLLRIEDWAFDAELLFLATDRGYRLHEVPVAWADHAGTKVRLLRDAWQSLRSLVRIRGLAAQQHYERPLPIDEPVVCWSPADEHSRPHAG